MLKVTYIVMISVCCLVFFALVVITLFPTFSQEQLKTLCLEPYVFSHTYRTIPNYLWVTVADKATIPRKVWQNLAYYAPNYQLNVLDDQDARRLLTMKFSSEVVQCFDRLSGAHRADLIRYCVLYVYGGVYLDIKTQLIRPLDEVFTKGVHLYTCHTSHWLKNRIYQGVIATVPHHPLFLRLIRFILHLPRWVFSVHYLCLCCDFYFVLQQDTGNSLRVGWNDAQYYEVYLFNEYITSNPNMCEDGLDRHGVCSQILDGTNFMIKTRYADYPWCKN